MLEFLFRAAAGVALVTSLSASPVRVSLESTEDGWRLVRDGNPMFVRGAGGSVHLEALAAAGGNCVRTWGGNQTVAVLDEAHRLGMTVIAGLWLTQERQGFDYDNPAEVAAQHERLMQEVLQAKDHPALLAWGVGNELDLEGKNPAVWDAVEKIARFIREVDPDRPLMTVTTFVKPATVALIRERAPSIEILGVNVYGGLEDLPKAIRESGWEGPYMVTEWGPNGPWESKPTSWGARWEMTSTAVARLRRDRHAILESDPRCLGGHVFLWGMKDETTPTWFSMFLDDGTPLGSVDAMTEAWGGTVVGPAAPAIEGIVLGGVGTGEDLVAAPRQRLEASLVGLETGGPATIAWKVKRDDHEKRTGGDPEDAPERIGDIWTSNGPMTCFEAPATPGHYRLYVVVRAHGKAAAANFPFLVSDPNAAPADTVAP